MFRNLKCYFYLTIIIFAFNITNANELNNEVVFLNNLKITSLMRAVAKNDTTAIKIFLDNNSSVNEKNIANVGVLHVAVKNNALSALKLLVDKKADINMIDEEGWTPLMRACSLNNSEAAKLLIDLNANIWLKNIFNESALVVAATNDCNDCIKFILEKDLKLNKKNSFWMDDKLIDIELEKATKIAYRKQNIEIENLLKDYAKNREQKIQNQQLTSCIEKILSESGNMDEKDKLVLNAKKIKEKNLKKYLQNKYKYILK